MMLGIHHISSRMLRLYAHLIEAFNTVPSMSRCTSAQFIFHGAMQGQRENFFFDVRLNETEVSLRRDDTIKDFQALTLLTRHQTDTPAAIYSGLPYLRVALAYQFLI